MLVGGTEGEVEGEYEETTVSAELEKAEELAREVSVKKEISLWFS